MVTDLFVLFTLFALAADVRIQGTASVIDGDTLDIHGQRIRLHGIDAVESGQICTEADGRAWRCGRDAAFALADKIGRAPVRCEQRDIDRYQRIIAVCYLGNTDLNAWMVAEGWAVAYRHYSLDYVPQEDSARAARRGMWRAQFDMPWDWRRARRGDAAGWQPDTATAGARLMQLVQRNYSCSPRRTCKQIGSCDEARWYLANCSWGGALDRDGDGVPCETICGGR